MLSPVGESVTILTMPKGIDLLGCGGALVFQGFIARKVVTMRGQKVSNSLDNHILEIRHNFDNQHLNFTLIVPQGAFFVGLSFRSGWLLFNYQVEIGHEFCQNHSIAIYRHGDVIPPGNRVYMGNFLHRSKIFFVYEVFS